MENDSKKIESRAIDPERLAAVRIWLGRFGDGKPLPVHEARELLADRDRWESECLRLRAEKAAP